jgi:hypothetical protein
MRRRPNDVGGLPADAIKYSSHEPVEWERLITAIVETAGRRLATIDAFRRTREDLDQDFYNSLSYFELWTEGFVNLMQEKGVFTRADVERRMAELRAKA